MGYTLGLDVGIASVGFAGKETENEHIAFSGVHIFDTAENPKTGASLAEPRRNARGQRRVIRRRVQRKKNIRKLLLSHGFSKTDLQKIDHKGNEVNVWQLRAEGLSRALTASEFARVLFHIAKRRGFQSNSKKAEANDTEGKKALEGSKQLQEAMVESGARTIGEHLAKLDKQRNGSGNYERFVVRKLLRDEVKTLFKEQTRLGNGLATEKLREAYENIAFTQRPLQSSEKLVGMCFLEPKEKRAPKFSYSAELFVLWSKLNNLRIKEYGGGERALTQDEKNRTADLVHKNKEVKYKAVRKLLSLGEEDRFNISYRKTDGKETDWEKIRDSVEGRTVFMAMKGYHALKDALGASENTWQAWIGNKREKLDDIARVLSFNEDIEQITKQLKALDVDDNEMEALLKITDFKKPIDISAKAARNILPFMQQGMTYDKACAAAGYDFNKRENQGLGMVPKFEPTRNPVVDRSLSQVRKVVNAVIRRYGMPETIIVEVANELGKPKYGRRSDSGRYIEGRVDIEKKRAENQRNKETAQKHAEEIFGREVNGEEILKYRLWMEQKGFCPYSGEEIKPELLSDPVATQIDHILPYSRSYDDSYMNKVLCLTDENQRKGNKTPYEYLQDTKAWEALEYHFAPQMPRAKAERLIMKDFDESKADTWKSRHLNDTRYITKLLKNHLEQSLDLGKGNRVQTRNGALTAHLRGAWGFPDKNRENDRHHALDAIVLACSTQSMVQKLTNWNKYEARKKNPQERPKPPLPWDGFREDAKRSVEEIFVSRMPNRKVTGQAHEETVRSIRHDDNGKQYIVQRVPLTSLKPAMLENLVDKEGRNKNLYDILKARLDEHKGDPAKAFAIPVKLVGKSGDESKAAVINSVRIVTSEKSGVEINGGLASNGSMVRVDVFKKEGKFYLCPVYVHQMANKTLPMGLIKAATDEKDWPQVDDSYEFQFSLYKNDLVRVVNKGQEYIGYYRSAHRGVGTIKLIAHDNDPSFGKKGELDVGVQRLEVFEKYVVNYFGEKFKVKGGKRIGMEKSAYTKSGEAIA